MMIRQSTRELWRNLARSEHAEALRTLHAQGHRSYKYTVQRRDGVVVAVRVVVVVVVEGVHV
jgi:hypothetical protein